MRKNVNVMRVGVKLATAIIALYVSGFLVDVMGQIMNGTSSPFYTGLKLIGWTVSTTGQITAYNGTGILSIIGLLAIAWIVFEFVDYAA